MSAVPDIARLDDRLDAIETALRAALPARVVKRSLIRHIADQSADELRDGIVMLVSSGESDYSNGLGMIATEGTQRVLLIGHLKVGEQDAPQTIEAAELDLIEDIKGFVRAGVPGMSVRLESMQHSRQLEHPYGWVVAFIDAGPQRLNHI